MEQIEVSKEQSESISTLVNPFSKASIERIKIEIYPEPSAFWRNGKKIEAAIWFKKNATSGSHQIYGDTLSDICLQIKSTIENL
jgi:hypothetical protein